MTHSISIEKSILTINMLQSNTRTRLHEPLYDHCYRTTFASCDLVQKVSSTITVKYQMSLSVTENKQGSLVHHFT